MIINNLNPVSIAIFPDEADPILIVYPDAVLSQSAPFQRFQPVSRENGDIGERPGRMDLYQLSFNHGAPSIEPFGRKPLENQFSIFGPKGSNHPLILVRGTSYVNI
jgi:hypothetical protein